MAWLLKSPPGEIDLAGILGADLAARVRTLDNPRARRVSLRVDTAAGVIVLVRPRRVSPSFVTAFVSDKRNWIADQLARLPEAIAFENGMSLSVLGEALTVQLAPEKRGGVWRDGDALFVSGRPEHAPRRIRDWLKEEARRHFGPMARELASTLERSVTRLMIRDPRSRWGSCNRDGTVSLSWRLMLAPAAVARYVVAHEVAHLKHMNHRPAFWRTVDTLVDDADSARAWLKRHGASLHGILKT